MKLLNDQISSQLKEVFTSMKSNVTIALFTKEDPCSTCKETKAFMEEINDLSKKLNLKIYDVHENADLARDYNVNLTPSIVLLDATENYKGVKFNGMPSGHEINSFIRGILEVSGQSQELPQNIKERLNKISKPVNIKVFVTLGCPHCSGAVEKAHQLALANSNIDAEMVEAQTFYDLSNKFNVSSVPKIVINDQYEFVGNQPLEVFIQEIEKTQ